MSHYKFRRNVLITIRKFCGCVEWWKTWWVLINLVTLQSKTFLNASLDIILTKALLCILLFSDNFMEIHYLHAFVRDVKVSILCFGVQFVLEAHVHLFLHKKIQIMQDFFLQFLHLLLFLIELRNYHKKRVTDFWKQNFFTWISNNKINLGNRVKPFIIF